MLCRENLLLVSSIRERESEHEPSLVADKRSRHLGSDGIYLDDITELEPEVAALYFPKRYDTVRAPRFLRHARRSRAHRLSLRSDGGAAARSLHGGSLSPQSAGSGGDSGVDSYCEHAADGPTIAISLCGGLHDNREITKGEARRQRQNREGETPTK